MDKFILVIHFLACFLLIVAVLLQNSKGSAMGVFGGGGGDALFTASSGASFIKRFTLALACVIALTSILLTIVGSRSGMHTVLEQYGGQPPVQAPAATPAAAPAPNGQNASAPETAPLKK